MVIVMVSVGYPPNCPNQTRWEEQNRTQNKQFPRTFGLSPFTQLLILRGMELACEGVFFAQRYN